MEAIEFVQDAEDAKTVDSFVKDETTPDDTQMAGTVKGFQKRVPVGLDTVARQNYMDPGQTIAGGGFTAMRRESAQTGAYTEESREGEAAGEPSEKATVVESTVPPHQTDYDTTNPIAPVRPTQKIIKKQIYPPAYEGVKLIQYNLRTAEELYGDEMRRLQALEQREQELDEKLNGPSDKRKVKVTP